MVYVHSKVMIGNTSFIKFPFLFHLKKKTFRLRKNVVETGSEVELVETRILPLIFDSIDRSGLIF